MLLYNNSLFQTYSKHQPNLPKDIDTLEKSTAVLNPTPAFMNVDDQTYADKYETESTVNPSVQYYL